MGRKQRWPERAPRPKIRRLAETEKQTILRTLEKGIVASPVLPAFGVQARVRRGRFYIERHGFDEDSLQFTEVLGRITPLCVPWGTLGGVHDQAQREQNYRSSRGLVGQAKVAGVVMPSQKQEFNRYGDLHGTNQQEARSPVHQMEWPVPAGG